MKKIVDTETKVFDEIVKKLTNFCNNFSIKIKQDLAAVLHIIWLQLTDIDKTLCYIHRQDAMSTHLYL